MNQTLIRVIHNLILFKNKKKISDANIVVGSSINNQTKHDTQKLQISERCDLHI